MINSVAKQDATPEEDNVAIFLSFPSFTLSFSIYGFLFLFPFHPSDSVFITKPSLCFW